MSEFKCIKGCAFCCSPVPMLETMLFKNQKKQVRNATRVFRTSPNELLLYTRDMKCIFLREDNKCNIYEDRPEVCRTFGQNLKQPCPYLKINGSRRNNDTTRILIKRFKDRIKKMK